MKTVVSILLTMNVLFLYGQPCWNSCILFDEDDCLGNIIIDSTSSADNIWQVGRPVKPLFNTALSPPYVIITDTSNYYPVNNYSAFTIQTLATMGDVYGFRSFTGAYYVQTDSINDFGRIEFSPDNGTNWIDMINDTTYNVLLWYGLKPVLTGNSRGWKYFEVLLAEIGSVFNIKLNDTLLFRFTFESDSIADSLGGLMYDNFCFNEFVEGISDVHYTPIRSNGYPNPSSDIFTISFDYQPGELFELAVYDIKSKLLLQENSIRDNKITINTKDLKAGTYVYKLTSHGAQKRAWGKFIRY